MGSPQDNNINVISEHKVSPENDKSVKFPPKEEKANVVSSVFENLKPEDAELTEILKSGKISRINETVFTSETFQDKDKDFMNVKIPNAWDYKDDMIQLADDPTTSQGNASIEEPSNTSNAIFQTERTNITQQFPCTISADRFLCMDIKSSCMSKISSATDNNAVKLLEQNTIDLKKNNIDLKNSLKELNRKYNVLSETVRQIKSELQEISLHETAKEPLSDQFRNIKTSCENIMKMLSNINALLQ